MEKLDELSKKVDELSIFFLKKVDRLDKKVDNLENLVRAGFTGVHEFDRKRVEALKSSTNNINFNNKETCNKGSATIFSVYYRGKIARVFAPHFNCSGVNPFPDFIFTDDFHDLAVGSQCPTPGTHAINITSSSNIKLGDDVILYGVGDTANVWKGVLSGLYHNQNNCELATPWHGNGSVCNGEFLFQSHQHNGLSGSPVSNGCGFVGMAHAIQLSSSGAVFAAVIGWAVIIKLIEKFYSMLSFIDDCEDIHIVNLPHFPFSDCDEQKQCEF
jgi:hypothetical protein